MIKLTEDEADGLFKVCTFASVMFKVLLDDAELSPEQRGQVESVRRELGGSAQFLMAKFEQAGDDDD